VSSRARSIGWRLAVPLVAAAGGLLCVSSALSADGIDLRAGTTDLTQVVVDRSRQVAQLRTEQRAVREDIRELSAGLGDVNVDAATKRVQELSPAAGLTAVRGEGLVVVLTDTPRDADVPEGIDPNLLVVHQQDIQGFVNALWAGGAEGISLQGQRLTTTTGIKCVGNSVVLQGVPYAPPYRIVAVGDVASLQSALDTSEAVRRYREYVEYADLGLRVAASQRLTVPAYAGSTDLAVAQPLD
jgi:uncharacterized protein YlxW (UPF0749 family)